MKHNFILIDKVSHDVCNKLVRYFNNNKNSLAYRGMTAKGVTNSKKSLDIAIDFTNDNEPFLQYKRELQKCLDKYMKIYPETYRMDRYQMCENYNIQHYEPGEGFKDWHSERGTVEDSKRVLVFMTYLTNTKNAGTHFKYQN